MSDRKQDTQIKDIITKVSKKKEEKGFEPPPLPKKPPAQEKK